MADCTNKKIHNSKLTCGCNTRSMHSYTPYFLCTSDKHTVYMSGCEYNSYGCRCVSRWASCTCAERTYQNRYQVLGTFYTTSLCDVHEIRTMETSSCNSKTYSYCDCRIREFTDQNATNISEQYVGYREACVEVIRDCQCNGRTTTGLIPKDLLPVNNSHIAYNSFEGNTTNKCTNTNRYDAYMKADYIYTPSTISRLSYSDYFADGGKYNTSNTSTHCFCQYRQKAMQTKDIHLISDTNWNWYFSKKYRTYNNYTVTSEAVEQMSTLEDCYCKQRSIYTRSYLSTDCNCVSREVYNTNNCQNDECYCNVQAHICDCQKRSMLEDCPCDMRQWGDVCTCNEKDGKQEYGYCECDFRNLEVEEYQYVKMSDCRCQNRAFPEISCLCDSRNTACYIHTFIDSSYSEPFDNNINATLCNVYRPTIIANVNNPGITVPTISSALYNTFACDCNGRDFMKDKTEEYNCQCFFKSLVSEYAKVKFIPTPEDYVESYDRKAYQYYVEQQDIDPDKIYAIKVSYWNVNNNTEGYHYGDNIQLMYSVLVDETMRNNSDLNKEDRNRNVIQNFAIDVLKDDINKFQVYNQKPTDAENIYSDCSLVYTAKNYSSSAILNISSNSQYTGNCTYNKCQKVYLDFKIYNDHPFVYEKIDNTQYFKNCTTVNAIDDIPEGCDIFVSQYNTVINPCNSNTCEIVHRLKSRNQYYGDRYINITMNNDTFTIEKYPLLIANECVCKSRYIQDALQSISSSYTSYNIYNDTALIQPFNSSYNSYRDIKSVVSTTLCECQNRIAECDCQTRTDCLCQSRNDYISSNPDVRSSNPNDIPDPNHRLNTCDCKNRNTETCLTKKQLTNICELNWSVTMTCDNHYDVDCGTREGTSCKIVEFCRCNLRKNDSCIEVKSQCTRYTGLQGCVYDHSISLDCLTNTVGECPETSKPNMHECPYNITGCTGRWNVVTYCYTQGLPECECNHTSQCTCNLDFCTCNMREGEECECVMKKICECQNRGTCTCDVVKDLLCPYQEACTCNIDRSNTKVCICQSRTDTVCPTKHRRDENMEDCICNYKYKSCECRGRCVTNFKQDFFLAGEDVSHVTDENALKPNPQDPNDI